MTDQVHQPSHYNDGDIECIDAIQASLTPEGFLAYLKGNVMKYLWRFEHKAEPAQDLAKAYVYLGWLQDALAERPLEKKTTVVHNPMGREDLDKYLEGNGGVLTDYVGFCAVVPPDQVVGVGETYPKFEEITETGRVDHMPECKRCRRRGTVVVSESAHASGPFFCRADRGGCMKYLDSEGNIV